MKKLRKEINLLIALGRLNLLHKGTHETLVPIMQALVLYMPAYVKGN